MCAIAYGCSGEIDTGPLQAGLTPQEQVALEDWLNLALPAFQEDTCVMCHTGDPPAGYGSAPPYLQGSDMVAQRDQAIATLPPVVNLSSPKSSRVLVKGTHEGPPLDVNAHDNILMWIEAEAVARGGSAAPLPESSPDTLMDCVGGAGSSTCPTNTIDLTSAGAPAGTTISFTETPYDTDGGSPPMPEIQLQTIVITAGAQGLHVAHPLFGTVVTAVGSDGSSSTSTVFDPEDRYFATDAEVDPNGTLSLSGTTIDSFFDGFDHTNPLVIQFDALGPEDAGGGSGSGSG